jgi:hypothetical protein
LNILFYFLSISINNNKVSYSIQEEHTSLCFVSENNPEELKNKNENIKKMEEENELIPPDKEEKKTKAKKKQLKKN